MQVDYLTQDEINEVVSDAMSDLPEEIQAAIENSNWGASIRDIALKYKLRADQGALLENHVLFTMIGINKADHLIQVIEKFGLDDETTTDVINDIETLIFDKIKEQVMGHIEPKEQGQFKDPLLDPSKVASRDSILAEIEKDEPVIAPRIASNVVMPGTGTIAASSMGTNSHPDETVPVASMPTESSTTASPATRPDRLGLRTESVDTPAPSKPFSVSPEPAPAQNPASSPATAEAKPAVGIQQDPIAAGLTKPTQTAAPTAPAAPKTYASDPYREPIE